MPELGFIQTIPTIIPGPDHTVCVNPAVFSELVAMEDAKLLCYIVFTLGIILGFAICYMQPYVAALWEKHNGD